MKRFLKYVVITITLVLMIVVSAPLAIGFIAKKQFYGFVNTFGNTDQMQAKVINYDQGWFTSKATVEYSAKIASNHLADNTTDIPELKFTVYDIIHHGPVIFTPNPDVKNVPFQLALALIETKASNPNLDISGQTIFRLNGKITTTFNSKKITSHAESFLGASFVLQGLNAKVDGSSQADELDGQLSLESLDIVSGKEHQRVRDIDFKFTLSKDVSDIWTGDRFLNIASIDFESKQNQKIGANQTKIHIYNDIKNNRMRTGLNANVNSVKIDNRDYGRQSLSFAFDNIETGALATLSKQLEQIQAAPQYRMFAFGSIYTQVLNLLSKGMSFHLDQLALTTTWGKVSGQTEITLPEQASPAVNINQILTNLIIHGRFTFPTQLAQEVMTDQLIDEKSTASNPRDEASKAAKEKIQKWVDAGWLRADGDNYHVEIIFEQKQLLINGKPYQAPLMTVNPVLPNPNTPAKPTNQTKIQ